jgi:hypothetical protein
VATRKNQYTMALDSGASISLLAIDKVKQDETLEVCNVDLGPDMVCQKLSNNIKIGNMMPFQSTVILLPIDPRFSLDGILGADFFGALYIQLNLSLNQIHLKKY